MTTAHTWISILETVAVLLLIYGFIHEEKIATWEQEIFFPKIKKIFLLISEKIVIMAAAVVAITTTRHH